MTLIISGHIRGLETLAGSVKIFRNSPEELFLSREWKRANIMLIFQKDDTEIALNYKQVSLSLLYMLLENITGKYNDNNSQSRNHLNVMQY